MSNFAEILKDFKDRLYSLPSKQEVMSIVIKEKLDNSYNNYKNNLEKTYNYILSRNNLKVLRTLKREADKLEPHEDEEEFEDE